ncbi:MAG: hypothetical protein HZB29_08850 [Nitrospinae bacterium]|nr:hypothetical protein [Nitrospinota bacterium]
MGERIFSLVFPDGLVKEPVLFTLVKRYGLSVNILRASVSADSGWMVVGLSGEAGKIEEAILDLKCRGAMAQEGGRELLEVAEAPKLSGVRVRIVIPGGLVGKPVLSDLIKSQGVMVNIRQARIGEDQGILDVEMSGSLSTIDSAMDELKKMGVRVDPIEGNVIE